MRLLPIVLASILLLSVVSPVMAQDENDDVNDEIWIPKDKTTEFEESGNVTFELNEHWAKITLSKDTEGVELDGIHSDSLNDFVRIQYSEEQSKTFRFYIPGEYIQPRTQRDLQASNADVTADLTPARGSSYMMLQVRVTGPTDATFKLSKEAGVVFGYVESYNKRLNESTGFEIPSVFGSSEPWHYVAQDEFTSEEGEIALSIERPEDVETVMVQYDKAGPGDEKWLPVSSCQSGTDAPVCSFERANDTQVHILAQDSEAAPIRYKYGIDRVEKVKESIRDLTEAPNRLRDWLSERKWW